MELFDIWQPDFSIYVAGYLIWFIAKIFLYVVPLSNIILLSHSGNFSHRIVLFLYLIPIIEIIAYFYIITSVLPRIFDKHKDESISDRCLEYGLAAGIVNIVLLSRTADYFDNYFTFYNYSSGLITTAMDSSLLAIWLILAVSHVKLLHDVKLDYIRRRLEE